MTVVLAKGLSVLVAFATVLLVVDTIFPRKSIILLLHANGNTLYRSIIIKKCTTTSPVERQITRRSN